MTLREYKELADNNEWPFIPNPDLITNEHVPYLDPTTISIVTGNSSAGKSSYTKSWMFKYVEFAIANTMKFKVVWICLEETIEQFQYSVKGYLLGKRGYSLNMADMMSVSIVNGKRRILSDDELQACDDIIPEYEQFMDYFILENPRSKNPTGIYKFVRDDVAKNYGNFYFKGSLVNEIGKDQFDRYESDYEIMLVIDNVNNITTEKGQSKKEAIRKLVGEYCNQYITKYFKFHTICLQQQWKTSLNLDHITAGHIYPTIDGLAEDKDTGNDSRLIIGICDPFEHEKMIKWPTSNSASVFYEKGKWKDRFRVINIPKNTLFGSRITTTDRMIPVEFGAKGLIFDKL